MRQKILYFLTSLVICAGVFIALEPQAHAYVDPGNGLLALQAIGSAIAAVGFYLRRRIFALFHKKPAPADQAETTATTSGH